MGQYVIPPLKLMLERRNLRPWRCHAISHAQQWNFSSGICENIPLFNLIHNLTKYLQGHVGEPLGPMHKPHSESPSNDASQPAPMRDRSPAEGNEQPNSLQQPTFTTVSHHHFSEGSIL
jgi:hypothetical protein